MLKYFVLILVSLLLFFFTSITFLSLGNLNRVSADHCDSCQTTDPDWCYDPDIDEWYECGHSCGGDPCGPSCNTDYVCKETFSNNACCNNYPNNWTPSPTGNNVCNTRYFWYEDVNNNCACTNGPWPEDLPWHDCADRPACGICVRGQTRTSTETRNNVSCTNSPAGGQCPGQENLCAQLVQVQRKTIIETCNQDCGGWSVTDPGTWITVSSSPQCPNDPSVSCGSCTPGVTPRYRCINNECRRDDTGGFTTDPNCGGQCAPPPPQTRYSCSGSACVINANGPYTVSNCNNACTAPPGGCSVGWTLNNENPPPNSSIQVKIRGISDPQGWQNIRLTLDGSNTGNLAWPPENPWPTFVYNNVPTNSGGGHTLEFRTNNGSRTCAPSKTFTTQSPPPPPPTCTNTTPGTNQLTGCLWDGVNFNVAGGNAPNGLTNDSINNPLIPPAGDTVYSATALNQDWGLGGPPPPNDFMGSDTFSARWRGNFTFKKGTYTFKVGSDDGVRLKVDGAERIDIPPGKSWRDQSWDFLDKYTTQVVFDSQRTVPLELEYYENGGQAKITLSWNYTPPVTIKPWIQTIGGDVHSNVSIKMRGN